MQEKRRKITAILVLISMFIGGTLMPQNSMQAQAAMAKKTVKVTLDTANPDASISLITIPKKPKASIWKKPYSYYKKQFKKNSIKIKVKILEVEGTPKWKKIDTLMPCSTVDGTGSLFYDVKANKFKKGKVLKSRTAWTTHLNVDMPEGVTKVTYKITFASASGKRLLKKVKVVNKYVDFNAP